MLSAVCLLLVSVSAGHWNLWIDQSHRDFQAGREYYQVRNDAVTEDADARGLRAWEIGTNWWSPACGGLRILEKDFDLDDNGWKDVILSDNTGSCELRLFWNDGGRFPTRTTLFTAPYECEQATHVADLNGDGIEDILAACGTYSQTSYIFYGTADPHRFRRDSVLTQSHAYGAQQVLPVDLNKDGHLDLWITATDEAWIQYGPDLGFRAPDRVISVPDGGYLCTQVFADVNYDGYVDAVLGQDNGPYVTIAWGPGFTRFQRLEGSNCWDPAVADLNADGWLDILAPAQDTKFIYWGSQNDFSESRRTEFDGSAEGSSAVADFDNDGVLDIVLCEIGSWDMGPSRVLYGPGYQRGVTLLGGCVVPADYNNDGWPDLLMSFYHPAAKLYWNREGRFSPTDYTTLAAVPDDGIVDELGNTWDRGNTERFMSRVHDILPGGTVQGGANECCLKVGVYGELPGGNDISVQVRASLDGRHWSPWRPPFGAVPCGAIAGGNLPCFGRFFQYRLQAELDHNRTTLLSVDSVKCFVELDAASVVQQPDRNPPASTLETRPNAFRATVLSSARLRVYDASGRLCRDLLLPAGEHLVTLDACPGIYTGQLEAEAGVLTRRLVVTR